MITYNEVLIKDIQKLKLSADGVADHLFSNPELYLFRKGFLSYAIRSFGLLKNTRLIDLMNTEFISAFNNVKWYYQADSMFLSVTELIDLFTDQGKSGVFEAIIKNKYRFSQSIRKRVIAYLATGPLLPDQDERLERVFSTYYRSIKGDQLEQLLQRIDGGRDNPTVAKVMSKSRIFNYLDYTEDRVKADPKERARLVKDVAQTQTVLKRLPFDFTIGFDDIHSLPPVMRFDFLQFAYEVDMDHYCRNYYTYSWNRYDDSIDQTEIDRRIESKKIRRKIDKMKVELIDPEKVKELLFSVSLQKNDKVSNWLERYTKFYNIKIGKEQVKVVKGF